MPDDENALPASHIVLKGATNLTYQSFFSNKLLDKGEPPPFATNLLLLKTIITGHPDMIIGIHVAPTRVKKSHNLNFKLCLAIATHNFKWMNITDISLIRDQTFANRSV